MTNRDLVVNTFEGGLDLDTDSRLVKNNKLRSSNNIDITKRGDSFIATDIKGEIVMFDFEGHADKQVYMLASKFVTFLVEPTSETRRAALVFYVTSENKFIIKALYTDDSSQEVILEETLTASEFEQMKDSTVDLDVVGKFGYDVVYFVDNRRQPRKIDCVTYSTNSNVMTLTFNSLVDGDGYKQVNLNLNSSSVPVDAHRCYVYAYKTGGSLFYSPVNPLTETVKYLTVNYSGDQTIFFNIYPEDYADYTFQIVYHKEGSVTYRNFTIGNPFQVMLSVGALSNFIIGLRWSELSGSVDQVDSWEFLYSGVSFPAYTSTPTIEIGTTILYQSETEDPVSIVPDGYYQRADMPNTHFRVVSGIVTEQDTNHGVVLWGCLPSPIEADVRAAAFLIEEGDIDRLQGITIHVPSTITVGGVVYGFVKTTANSIPARLKESSSNNYTYTLEYPNDRYPISFYSPSEVDLQVFLLGVSWIGNGYFIRCRATITSAISEDLLVNLRVQARDKDTGSYLTPALITITIPSGNVNSDNNVNYYENGYNECTFGPVCVVNFTYTGTETINNINAC